jgi:hypothetical protein
MVLELPAARAGERSAATSTPVARRSGLALPHCGQNFDLEFNSLPQYGQNFVIKNQNGRLITLG